MRGHVRKRGKSWQVIVKVADPSTGKPRQMSGTRPTRAAADLLLLQLLNKAGRSGALGSSATVGDLLTAWQELRAADWAPVTIRQTRMLVEHYVRPRIGKVRLSKLRTSDLDALYADLRARGSRDGEALAVGTVARVHTALSSALSQAVKWEWLADNPAGRATLPKGERHRIVPPTPAEVFSLVDAAYASDDPDFAVALHLLAATGARRGELCALRWADIDLEHPTQGTVRIARALSMGDTVVERGTKTGNVRRISLDADTTGALRAYRIRRAELALATGVPLPTDGFVFSGDAESLRPWRPDMVTRRFVRLRDALGLTVRLHDLRHFHATWLLARGIDLTTVAGRLGHANGGQTTQAVYAHFLEHADQHAATAIGEVLTRG